MTNRRTRVRLFSAIFIVAIDSSAITANNKGQLHQNFGYDGYDAGVAEWDNWKDAVADEDVTN